MAKIKELTIVTDEQELKKIPVRVMTRGQVKELRAKGIDPGDLDEIPEDTKGLYQLLRKQKSLINWILDNVYPEFDFDKLPNPIVDDFAQRTYRKTMGTDEEIKN
jgi:hypothetical protein